MSDTISDGQCKDCGSNNPGWFMRPTTLRSIPDGRLRMSEVSIQVVQGCNECGATLKILTPEDFLSSLGVPEMHSTPFYG